MWVLSLVGTIVGFYVAFKLSGIAIQWVKEGLNSIRPERYKR